MRVRQAVPGDGDDLASLLRAYLAEQFPGHTGSGAEALERDVLSGASGLRILVAEADDQVVGFVAWHRVYDLHWGKSGAQVADLYVIPARRGLGVALTLLSAVCAAAEREGGAYLHGAAFDRASPVGRFYERFAVAFDSAECYCGGRAFRQLAGLHGEQVRRMVGNLPPKSWNHEP